MSRKWCSKGLAVSCALLFLASLVALVLSVSHLVLEARVRCLLNAAGQVSYRIENRRRDKLYGKPDPDATVDTSELADAVSLRACYACKTTPE